MMMESGVGPYLGQGHVLNRALFLSEPSNLTNGQRVFATSGPLAPTDVELRLKELREMCRDLKFQTHTNIAQTRKFLEQSRAISKELTDVGRKLRLQKADK